MVISTVHERDRQGQVSGTPRNKDAKRLVWFVRKIYSTTSLQFWVSNDQALLGRYNFHLWYFLSKLKEGLL